MRRPLFGNGFPKRLLNEDGTVTVFDTNDFTPQEGAPQAFAVTLFCWHWQQFAPFNVLANLPAYRASLTTDGGATPALLASWSQTVVADVQAAQMGQICKPIKLLDRVIVRGDQQIKVFNPNANCTEANGMQSFIYGYFEAAGAIVPSMPFRPLQPSNNLAAPFSAAPVSVSLAVDNTEQFQDLHLLNSALIDLLDITVCNGFLAEGGPGTGTDIEAGLKFPDGTLLKVPFSTTSGEFPSSRPFEYQPAIGSGVIQAGFESSGTIAPGAVSLSAYGNFLRR